MADGGFGTFNVGNALLQREQIIAARQANEQQNVLAQRAAQFNPLLQQFLAGQGDANALFQADPARAQAAVEFQQAQQQQQQEQEQVEADEIIRGALLVKNSASPSTFLPLAFPEFAQGLEDQGIDVKSLSDDEVRSFADQMVAQFGAASSQSLEDLGIEEPSGDFIQFQNPATRETRDVRKDSPEADRLAADPDFQQVSRVQRIEQGAPGAFGTETQLGALQVDINEQAAAINSFGFSANQLLEIVGEGGANTLTASLANIGNRLRQEVRTLVNRAGVQFKDRSVASAFEQNNFKGAFEAAGLAGESARVKNAFLALAIQRAIASGLGSGRALSDKDIENQLQTLGRNQSDPEILRRIFIDDFQRLSAGVQFRGQASNLTIPELIAPAFIDGVDAARQPTDNSDASLRQRLGLPE